MNYLDIAILLPIAYGMIQGLRHGIVRELAALVAIIAGIYFARFWSPEVARYIVEWTAWDIGVCRTLAYVLIFAVISMAVHLLARIFSRLLRSIMLGGVNRALGAVFGIVKWTLVLSVVVNVVALLDPFVPIKNTPIVQSSVLYTHFEQLLWQILPGINATGFAEKLQTLTAA